MTSSFAAIAPAHRAPKRAPYASVSKLFEADSRRLERLRAWAFLPARRAAAPRAWERRGPTMRVPKWPWPRSVLRDWARTSLHPRHFADPPAACVHDAGEPALPGA